MSVESLIALFTLAYAAAWTPGPNNMLLAASTVNFGLRRTVPHAMGIAIGFPIMVLLVGLFLGETFQQSPLLREILRWGGAALLLWIAWSIAISGGLPGGGQKTRPFTFIQAALFQWINPKGWVMATAITAQFVTVENPTETAAIVAAVFVTAAFTSAFGWAIAGQAIRRWLSSPLRIKIFNVSMGGLIALGVIYLVIH
jgi:threonine/homoserine/homoserine lactone efflux protein